MAGMPECSCRACRPCFSTCAQHQHNSTVSGQVPNCCAAVLHVHLCFRHDHQVLLSIATDLVPVEELIEAAADDDKFARIDVDRVDTQ